MNSANCKQCAKLFLKNHYGEALLFTFISLLLGGSVASGVDFSVLLSGTSTLSESESGAFSGVTLSLVSLVIGGAVSLGYVRYLFALSYSQPANLSILFSEFNRLGDAFLLKFLKSLYVLLWSLLFLIPGIMKGYSYSMSTYILTENPGMTASQALGHSTELMSGHRFRLFCLHLSFLGWMILSAFTLGIGYIFLFPYMEVAQFAFYLDLTGRRPITGNGF